MFLTLLLLACADGTPADDTGEAPADDGLTYFVFDYDCAFPIESFVFPDEEPVVAEHYAGRDSDDDGVIDWWEGGETLLWRPGTTWEATSSYTRCDVVITPPQIGGRIVLGWFEE